MVMMPGVTKKPEKHKGKPTNSTQLALENQTTTTDWTDLDLTAATSANAKWAYVKMVVIVDSILAGGAVVLSIRKNGDTPGDAPTVRMDSYHGDTASARTDICQWVEMDSGQVIEYTISIGGTIQVDCYLVVMDFIE